MNVNDYLQLYSVLFTIVNHIWCIHRHTLYISVFFVLISMYTSYVHIFRTFKSPEVWNCTYALYSILRSYTIKICVLWILIILSIQILFVYIIHVSTWPRIICGSTETESYIFWIKIFCIHAHTYIMYIRIIHIITYLICELSYRYMSISTDRDLFHLNNILVFVWLSIVDATSVLHQINYGEKNSWLYASLNLYTYNSKL